MFLLVDFQNLMDDRNEWPDDRLAPLGLLTILRRLLLLQNLLDRPEVQLVLLGGITSTHLIDKYVSPDSCPLVHVGNHSFPLTILSVL